MSSTPSRAPSSTQPALRIPTFDSMKRFSAATDFSDMPDLDFTKTMHEDHLMLPSYLLKEIDTGCQAGDIASSRYQCKGTTAGEGLKLDFGDHLARNRSDDLAEPVGMLEAGDQENSLNQIAVNARTSSRVPFNPSRPVSQFSTNDGITALPTLASRGLVSDPHHEPIHIGHLPPASRKGKASSALSGPIKRLRNLSFDSISFKLHKRRNSSLSCMNDATNLINEGKNGHGASTTKLSTPIQSPSSAAPSTPTTLSTPTPIARYTHTLATTIIPTYPRSSPLQSATPIKSQTHTPPLGPPPSPGQLLLPNDLTCLTALQDIISNLHAENETLKQQVKILREDWYATHDELLVERYEGWEKECQLEKLRNSSELPKGEDGKNGVGKMTGKIGRKEGGATVDGDDLKVVKKEQDDEKALERGVGQGLYDFKYMVGIAR